jgi:hypothetical protein
VKYHSSAGAPVEAPAKVLSSSQLEHATPGKHGVVSFIPSLIPSAYIRVQLDKLQVIHLSFTCTPTSCYRARPCVSFYLVVAASRYFFQRQEIRFIKSRSLSNARSLRVSRFQLLFAIWSWSIFTEVTSRFLIGAIVQLCTDRRISSSRQISTSLTLVCDRLSFIFRMEIKCLSCGCHYYHIIPCLISYQRSRTWFPPLDKVIFAVYCLKASNTIPVLHSLGSRKHADTVFMYRHRQGGK